MPYSFFHNVFVGEKVLQICTKISALHNILAPQFLPQTYMEDYTPMKDWHIHDLDIELSIFMCVGFEAKRFRKKEFFEYLT